MVATQVVEAGIDLSAAVLITEAAPWPSLVQRAGRCNRTGLVPDAELWWVAPARPQPYEQADIDASGAELARLEGRAVTGEDLLAATWPSAETPVAVLRRSDFTALFDTAPDLSGADVDISPYVRDAGGPGRSARLGDLDGGSGHRRAARRGQGAGSGLPLPGPAGPGARPGAGDPGMAAGSGSRPVGQGDAAGQGSSPAKSCWSAPPTAGTTRSPASIRLPAGWCPAALRSTRMTAPEDLPSGPVERGPAGLARLDRHSEDVRDQAAALLSVTGPALPGRRRTVRGDRRLPARRGQGAQDLAGRPVQPGARGAARRDRRRAPVGEVGHRRATAVRGRRRVPARAGLPAHSRRAAARPAGGRARRDLARYLVLAHHGKLRVQVRDPGDLAVLAAGEAAGQAARSRGRGDHGHPAAARPACGPAHRGPRPVPARR